MVAAKVVVALTMCLVACAHALTINDFPSNDLPGLALPIDDWDYVEEAAAPCCFPPVWQGNITSQIGVSGGGHRGDDDNKGGGGGGAKLIRSTVTVYTDSTNKRVAVRVYNASRHHNATLTFITLFQPTGASLYVINLANKSCIHKTLANATWRPQCLPANATLVSSFKLGSSAGGVQVNAWKFCGKTNDTRSRARAFVCGTILVDAQCIPVVIQDRGLVRPRPHDDDDEVEFDEMEMNVLDKKGGKGRGKGFAASAFFANVASAISDPTIFTPPEFCPKAAGHTENALELDAEEIPDALGRFVAF